MKQQYAVLIAWETISVNISFSPTEFNNSLPELLCSDEDSGNEDVLDMEYTDAEAENLKRNAEVTQSMTVNQVCV